MAFDQANYPFPLGGHPNGRYRNAYSQASNSAAQAAYSTYMGASPYASLGASAAPTTEAPIEDAGVTAGEIIGYRAWMLDSKGFLRGMFMSDYVWLPGKVEHAPVVDRTWGAGLHAFKTLADAKAQYGMYATPTASVAFGRVALWGEVIEHESGYRAEYAAIEEIFDLWEDWSFTMKVKTRKWHIMRWLRLGRPSNLELLQKRYASPSPPAKAEQT